MNSQMENSNFLPFFFNFLLWIFYIHLLCFQWSCRPYGCNMHSWFIWGFLWIPFSWFLKVGLEFECFISKGGTQLECFILKVCFSSQYSIYTLILIQWIYECNSCNYETRNLWNSGWIKFSGRISSMNETGNLVMT